MAIVAMANAIFDGVASSAEYNKVVANILDLDARMGAVLASSTAHARLGTLESRTTDTSGAVGIGNQRLSDRLGAGVTNVATADARFGAGVGTGSNVTTGSAAAQLADLRTRVTTVEAAGSGVAFAEYVGGASPTVVPTGYTTMPFPTAVLAGSGLTVLSGVVAGSRFQLGVGVWSIEVHLRFNGTGTGGAICLFTEGVGVDTPNPDNADVVLGYETATNVNGALSLHTSGSLAISSGTKIVRVTTFLSSGSASLAPFASSHPARPRITFQRLSP